MVFLRKTFEEKWPSGLRQLLGKQPVSERVPVGSNPIFSVFYLKLHRKVLNLNQSNSAKDFCIYLKGYLDAVGHNGLTAAETEQISKKLESLFTRPETPLPLPPSPGTLGGGGGLMRC